ncbi:MAG: HK97 family phage prohead protease [Tetragenococcus halophilus]|uniref:HK97 family phage prohead protease n=1 Tax=Tetragenococcus halophilus TaxID=51669 RepID=UPI00209ACD7A|nr:HK97 family phage prohead protease [Tetragenococcus halophilus]MDN6423985.1 HK97 family phage prohead protease [Tetragenococcus koreensis]MDN6641372.1 HK97 family phage prohead protease [Tetragenococcus sp.]MDN6836282.1 HK97 family phage prohead protease [Lactococcus lactis]MCO8296620.1 HK97 family phage prohead protease [Tetragenococcus halophilus]MDN6292356.1 HK97 family phage prohead protease [Tetragenococcus halophilus]
MPNSHVDVGQENMMIEGYAVLFNTLSEDLGGFREVIAPNALNDVDVEDVKCLIDHEFGYVIGRTKADTLKLTVDDKGLRFKCELPNTSYAKDIYESIKIGNVNNCSFRYTLPKGDPSAKTWTRENGEYVQTINKVDELIEVSIVTVPAYKDTSVEIAQRAKDFERIKELDKLNIALDLDQLDLGMS